MQYFNFYVFKINFAKLSYNYLILKSKYFVLIYIIFQINF